MVVTSGYRKEHLKLSRVPRVLFGDPATWQDSPLQIPSITSTAPTLRQPSNVDRSGSLQHHDHPSLCLRHNLTGCNYTFPKRPQRHFEPTFANSCRNTSVSVHEPIRSVVSLQIPYQRVWSAQVRPSHRGRAFLCGSPSFIFRLPWPFGILKAPSYLRSRR